MVYGLVQEKPLTVKGWAAAHTRTFGGLTRTINKPVLFLEPTAGLYSDTVPLNLIILSAYETSEIIQKLCLRFLNQKNV